VNRDHDRACVQLVADRQETAPAFVIAAAHNHRVTATKNCGMAYMLLERPELALPMIDRATKWLQVGPTSLFSEPLEVYLPSRWQDQWDSGELPCDEQAHYYNLLACITHRYTLAPRRDNHQSSAHGVHRVCSFKAQSALADWERAAADFHHVFAIEANFREKAKADEAARPETALAEVARQVWRGLCLQVRTMAVEQPEDFSRLVAALDNLSPQAAASARQIGTTGWS
jgi:hypothetical protein